MKKCLRVIASLFGVIAISVSMMMTSVADDSAFGDDYVPTVLITGSNRGIGLEFAKQYAERGWHVIATARKPEKAEALNTLAGKHDNIVIEQLDVTDFERVDALQAVPASRVGAFLYLEPLVAVLVAFAILASLLGGAAILIGVWLVNRRRS